jgi:hypothetical protein
VLSLDRDVYALLEAEAARQERDPWSQARWIITRALRPTAEHDDDVLQNGDHDAA